MIRSNHRPKIWQMGVWESCGGMRPQTTRATRAISVNLSAPVGPKLFILGEPVLHKYYTVYDWEHLQVGFALANNRGNTDPPPDPSYRGKLPDDVELLMQKGQQDDMYVEEEL